jgi:hypothetical protein
MHTQTQITTGAAKTGGLPFGRLIGHAGDEGHYEITTRSLVDVSKALNVTWTAQLVTLMADASGDADFYHWRLPAAHAQTGNDDITGRINQTQEYAKQAFENWVTTGLRRSVVQCDAGRAPEATLYLLGYTIHAVQDLAFHEGMTNAEHAFNDFANESPVDSTANPNYAEKMKLAQAGTSRLLIAYFTNLRLVSPQCWRSVVAFAGGGLDAQSRKKAASLGERDFGVTALWEYWRLSSPVEDAVNSGADMRPYFVRPSWLNNRREVDMNAIVDRLIKVSLHQ